MKTFKELDEQLNEGDYTIKTHYDDGSVHHEHFRASNDSEAKKKYAAGIGVSHSDIGSHMKKRSGALISHGDTSLHKGKVGKPHPHGIRYYTKD